MGNIEKCRELARILASIKIDGFIDKTAQKEYAQALNALCIENIDINKAYMELRNKNGTKN